MSFTSRQTAGRATRPPARSRRSRGCRGRPHTWRQSRRRAARATTRRFSIACRIGPGSGVWYTPQKAGSTRHASRAVNPTPAQDPPACRRASASRRHQHPTQGYQSESRDSAPSPMDLAAADRGDGGDVDEGQERQRPGLRQHRRGRGDSQQEVEATAHTHVDRAEESLPLPPGVVEEHARGRGRGDDAGGSRGLRRRRGRRTPAVPHPGWMPPEPSRGRSESAAPAVRSGRGRGRRRR